MADVGVVFAVVVSLVLGTLGILMVWTILRRRKHARDEQDTRKPQQQVPLHIPPVATPISGRSTHVVPSSVPGNSLHNFSTFSLLISLSKTFPCEDKHDTPSTVTRSPSRWSAGTPSCFSAATASYFQRSHLAKTTTNKSTSFAQTQQALFCYVQQFSDRRR